MKQADLAKALNDLNKQLGKANDEIQAKITDLESKINDADVPQEVTDALEALKTSAQKLDDISPDPSAPPVVPTPETGGTASPTK